MKTCFPRIPQILTLLAAMGMFGMTPSAIASDSKRQPLPAKYIEECASCHAPFPAKMLPAASWTTLMSSLDRHFGTDASVDAATALPLSQWLRENASRRMSARPPEDRLTKGSEFLREHREISPAVWSRPTIRSAGNCAACHTNSAEGRFSERDVRIPKQ